MEIAGIFLHPRPCSGPASPLRLLSNCPNSIANPVPRSFQLFQISQVSQVFQAIAYPFEVPVAKERWRTLENIKIVGRSDMILMWCCVGVVLI